MEGVFQEFIRFIEPTPKQSQDMITTIENLKSYLLENTSLDIIAIREFGSYAKNTNVRPMNDVDILVVFDARPYVQEGWIWNSFNPPKAQSMLSKLKGHIDDNPNYKRTETFQDNPTIVANLTSIKLELVPSFVFDGSLYIPNYQDKEVEWLKSDAVEFERKLIEYDELNNNRLLPFIKMLKVWKKQHNLEDNLLTSLGIEKITRDIFGKNNTISSYPSALVDWFNKVKNRSRNKRTFLATIGGTLFKGLTGGIWGVAVGFVYDFFNKPVNWELLNASHDLSKKALADIENGDYRGACLKYNRLFGSGFPNFGE